MKRIISVFAVLVLAFCLMGCQKELTGKEAVERFEEIEAVEVFQNEAAHDLRELLDLADEIANAKSSDLRTEKYEDLLKKKVEIDRVCNDFINLKDYPKACEGLYDQFLTAAKEIKSVSDYYEEAGKQYFLGNNVTGNSRMNEASPYISRAMQAIEEYKKLKEDLLSQD